MLLTKTIDKMDMKLRAILRGFIRWQIKEDLFKNIIIDYEIAERYLEETEKSLKDYGVLANVSQQRELLVAFMGEWNTNNDVGNDEIYKEDIDLFLATNKT